MTIHFSLADLSSFVPNGDLEHTKELILKDLDIDSIEDLTQSKELRKIDLSGNKLESVSFLRYCWSLTDVNLSNNNLCSINDLVNLECIKVLNISNNNITSLEGLYKSPGLRKSLKVLIANNNKIKHIPDLSHFKELETVVLSHNGAIKIESPKSHCENLKKISLSNNSLRDFPFCQNFNLVQELRLNKNKILKLSNNICYMRNIKILELGDNHISDIIPLLSLNKLRILNISKNPCITAENENNILGLIMENIPSVESLNGFSVEKRKGIFKNRNKSCSNKVKKKFKQHKNNQKRN
ncbi:conserved hypothetical Leucine Rich Repeat protein [Cryptosporidium ryanae]|uniref:conserved hypothetical Leucine Rich Repeat protein n=1 Tax=Cryptosporidium ryanae TaxID=515981 RepID=UPI00351A7C17|nr:conserved hypothetical Leucine Rich Repeat protein [Cryptosporidium ryanae]